MNWKSWGLLFGLISLVSTASAEATRVLLISDIDDTIKVSHILNWGGKLRRAANVMTPFRGMSDLFRTIKQQPHLDVKLAYVSNAPEHIVGMPLMDISHRTFLSLNQFPYGEVYLRESLKDNQHKVRTLRQLLREQQPDLVLLFGDNGERDPEFYQQISREFSGKVQVVSFIHQLYSTSSAFKFLDVIMEKGSRIHSGQIGYVTPVEVALELKNRKIINEISYRELVKKVLPQILRESWINWDGFAPVTFPFYKKCPDFQWKWGNITELAPLQRKIAITCQ